MDEEDATDKHFGKQLPTSKATASRKAAASSTTTSTTDPGLATDTGADKSARQCAVGPPQRPCNGVYARRLWDDCDNSLFLNEHIESEAFSKSTARLMLLQCKSCPLNCTNCSSKRPKQPCPNRSCTKDGVEWHSDHRGTFRPEGVITCYGFGHKGADQCRSCQWLEASTAKESLWQLLKLDGAPRKSPLHQTASKEEVKRVNGKLVQQGALPAPQKRNDLKTREDYKALLEHEKAEKKAMERDRDEQVANAIKRARFAERHQSTAEQVAAITTAECDRARGDAEQAKGRAAAATIEAATSRMGEAKATAAAENATQQSEAQAAMNELLVTRLEKEAAARSEAQRSADANALALSLASAEAELATQQQRNKYRFEREALENAHEAERKKAAQMLASTVERLNLTELQNTTLQEKLTSTLSQVRIWILLPTHPFFLSQSILAHRCTHPPTACVSQLADANDTIKQLQMKLDASIDKDDVTGFVQSLHDLERNDQLHQKDRTLLEHLSKRLRYTRGGKHGAIEGVMRSVQDLLVDKLCRQDYTLVADILHLACFEKAAAARSRDKITYFVGFNEHILEAKAHEIYDGELCCSMGDGTRTSMLIEKGVFFGRPYLLGEAFSPDVRLWPSWPEGGKGMMPMPQTVDKVHEYISHVREKTGDHEMSHEIVTEALNCMSDRTRPMLVYSLFPEPSKGFSSVHNLLYWAKLVQIWHDHSIRGVGFATDSCSTGLGAGTALMAPTPKDVAAEVPFLGLKDRDFIYCARWVGGRTMADGYHFDYYLKWFGDAPHLARSVRRNLAYDSRCLLYHSAANGSQSCAAMEVLQQLQDMYPRREAGFLTEVVTINKFRDQKGDAAYSMLESRTIEMLKEKRAALGTATTLYLTAYNYVLEPWVNPNMTNPMTITFNSWMGYALCRLQEIYATGVMGLDKDIYIPSYQVMRTTAAMAHTAVTHCQDLHLNYRHRLDANWSQGALRGGTTFPLEGFHSETRTGSVSKASAGDCNSTTRKWVELCSKLMRIRANRLKVALHGWAVRAARNVQRTDKIRTLRPNGRWGDVPDTFEYSLQCGSGGYNPPEGYDDFCDDLTQAKRAAQDAALAKWERENLEAAAQMKAKGLWPGRWDEAGGGKWQSATGVRLAGVNLVKGASTRRPVAVALATTCEGGVTVKLATVAGVQQVARPSGPDGVEAMLDPSMRTKMQQADKDAAAARAKMVAHLRTQHGVAEDELEADICRGAPANSDFSQLGVSAMAAHAQADHESLKEFLSAAHGKVLDELGQDMTGLLSGSKLKDREGRHQNTERVINACQAHERVSRDRGRRFMVFASEEERAAAIAAGHDCCRNSLLVVRVGLDLVALARVIRLKLFGGKGKDASPKSFKLEPGSDKQSFQLELLYPEAVSMSVGEDGEGVDVLRFRSSGRMLPHCSAAKVLRQVPGSSLHPLKDTVYAIMAADDALAYRADPKAGGLKPWATLEHLSGAQPLERDLQLPDNTVCFNCHEGWADEPSGPLLQCKGGCKRAFHSACHAHFPLETQICGRCSGLDTDICAVCDQEWSDPSKDSDYFTGEMVGCDGRCKRWFHQACHTPFITDAAVKSKKKWRCADCVAGRELVGNTAEAAGVNATLTTTAATTAANATANTANVTAPAIAAAATTAVATAIAATVAPLPACPLTMECIELVLIRARLGYGFGFSTANLVDSISQGGSAATAGLRLGDLIVMVNGNRLLPGERLTLEGTQREGTQLRLTCHRDRSPAEAAGAPGAAQKRQRREVTRPGMRSWDGVRTGDASRTHAQRMLDRFESGTTDSL